MRPFIYGYGFMEGFFHFTHYRQYFGRFFLFLFPIGCPTNNVSLNYFQNY